MSTKKAANDDSDIEVESDDSDDRLYSDDVSQDYLSEGDLESDDDLEKALDEFGDALDEDEEGEVQKGANVKVVGGFQPLVIDIPRSAESLALELEVTSDIEYEDEDLEEIREEGIAVVPPRQGHVPVIPVAYQPGVPLITIMPPVNQPLTLETLGQAPEVLAVTNILNLQNVPPEMPGNYMDYLKPYSGETPHAFATRKAITDAIAQPRFGLNNSQIIKIGMIWANKALTNAVYSPEVERVLADLSTRG